MKKYLAEFIGTAALVFAGVGAAVLAGEQVGSFGVAFAFGFMLLALIYVFGGVSGAHFNPAVSAGMWSAGRISGKEFARYACAQFGGALVGTLVVYLIACGAPGFTTANGFAENGFGAGFAGGYSVRAAMLFELVATLAFVRVILEITEQKSQHAGLVIGFALAALLMVGANITGGSLNPARWLAPAAFVGMKALGQVWVFLLIPTVAGILAGLLHREFGFNKKA